MAEQNVEQIGYEDERLLLLAATPKDAEMTRRIFAAVGVPCVPCDTGRALARELEGGVGTIVLTDQAVFSAELRPLIDYLKRQPAWSDLPVLLLAGGGADSPAGRRAMELLGNVTVLERPVHTASLVSVVRTLIRSRRRQYQIREHMTERERAQAERESLLTRERAARSEAERIGRVKDEFLATLSHELRTPLNAILGWAQILRGPYSNCAPRRSEGGAADPAAPADSEELSQGLETIERNARVQTQIIEDLLDMSRIISGKIRLDVQTVDLPKVVDAALDTVRPAADAKGIHLEKHSDADAGGGKVWGDPGRLQQVFWNLLSNAIKFTPREGHVDVELTRGAGLIHVKVADTGEGIAPQFLPHAFDRFRQADASTTRRHGGLGLGLAIVKQLVELHGGTIQATSGGGGQGATFVVSLPVLTAPGRAQRAEPVRRHADASLELPKVPAGVANATLNGVAVLIVDDDADARQLVRRMLEECDARVRTAASAEEALAAVHREPPDVLVSDIGMPGEDGYSLIRKIRALGEDRGGNIPAVALTAYARFDDRDAALRHGFQVHVAKPVQPVELVAIIASLARSRQAVAQLVAANSAGSRSVNASRQ